MGKVEAVKYHEGIAIWRVVAGSLTYGFKFQMEEGVHSERGYNGIHFVVGSYAKLSRLIDSLLQYDGWRKPGVPFYVRDGVMVVVNDDITDWMDWYTPDTYAVNPDDYKARERALHAERLAAGALVVGQQVVVHTTINRNGKFIPAGTRGVIVRSVGLGEQTTIETTSGQRYNIQAHTLKVVK